jgi:hemerythrin-like metal-binding protein
MGIGRFDDEHRHIFDVLCEIRASLGAGNLSGVRALLDALCTATESHFAEEEAIMDRAFYPLADEHRAGHDQSRAALRAMVALATAGKLDRLGEALADYTAGYFKAVLCHDGRLAHYLREIGMDVAPAAMPCAPCAPSRPQRPA